MAARPIPEPWLTAMIEAEVGDPRNGQPSFNALARKSGIASSTMWRIVDRRIKDVRYDTLEALATALKTKPETIAEWVGQSWATATSEYVPPKEASLMTERERKAVDEIIKTFTASRRTSSGAGGEKATDLNQENQASGTKKPRNGRSRKAS